MVVTVPPIHQDETKSAQTNTSANAQDAIEKGAEADLHRMDQQLQEAVHRSYSGEEVEDDEMDRGAGAKIEREQQLRTDASDDNDDSEPVGTVKLPDGSGSSDKDEAESDKADADANSLYEDDSQSNKEDGSASVGQGSDAGEEHWEAESNGNGDDEVENASRGNCIFCYQDEVHDPSEEFEEYLGCIACGDHSHGQCAREHDAIHEGQDEWRCPACIRNKLEPNATRNSSRAFRRQNGETHMAKELLPAHGGLQHSIFNEAATSGDLVNSARSLRKRKTSSVDLEEHVPVLRKRQRRTPRGPDSGVTKDQVTGNVDGPADTVNGAVLSPVRTRSRRTRIAEKEHCRVISKRFGKLVLGFRLNGDKLSAVANSSRNRRQNRSRRNPRPPPSVAQEPQTHFAPIPPTSHINPFFSLHDRDHDDFKLKPYGGVLSEADADTSRTLPTQIDRERFEQARQKAEEEWQAKAREAEMSGEPVQRASQKVSGPPSKIKYISFGGYEIETWYAAPYPEEYSRNRVLYICEFCLKYMNSDFVAWRHKLKCPAKHPPGDEIYRDGSISIFEVDGRKNPVYSQNLCLLAKLFLGSKTLYYDVEPFLFYIMTEYDDWGCHFVGYFSKEKRPSSANNVSCILTLPIHQRKGYGNLLIDFSYLLTRLESKTGSPEKPLSDMGLVSYRNYWRLVLSYQLRNQKTPVSIADLSERTGMTADDIVSALEGLRALVRDPVTKTYALRLNYPYFEECISNWESKGYVGLNPDALIWTPYIMGLGNQMQFDRAPIHAVAQREGVVQDEADEAEQAKIREVVALSEEQIRSNQNADNSAVAPATNGIVIPESAEPLAEHAVPPVETMTAAATDTGGPNGLFRSASPGNNGAANPAAGIPPTRFEIWPPVQAPTAKRRPGRPFGTRTTSNRGYLTPSAARMGGRSTPRRASAMAAATPTPNAMGVRRGRSSVFLGSPEAKPTGGKSNGVIGKEDNDVVENENENDVGNDDAQDVESENTQHVGISVQTATYETKDKNDISKTRVGSKEVSGNVNGQDTGEAEENHVLQQQQYEHGREEEQQQQSNTSTNTNTGTDAVSVTHADNGTTPDHPVVTNGRDTENRPKLTRSVSKKKAAIVEKLEMVIPADENGVSNRKRRGDDDADADADADADVDVDTHGEKAEITADSNNNTVIAKT